MNNEQFDRILHSKLAGHQVVPPPDVWANIEKRNSKRKGYVWWLAGLLLVFISAGLYFLISDFGNEQVSQSVMKVNQPMNTNIPSSLHQKPSDPLTGNTGTPRSEPHPFLNQGSNSSGQTVIEANTASSSESLNLSQQYSGNYPTAQHEFIPANLIWLYQIEYNSPSLSAASVVSKPFTIESITNNLSIVITAGPVFASKHLESKYNYPGDEKYIRYRQEAETRNSAWSASMLLQVELSKYLFLRTGVNYTSISEKIGMRYIKAQIDGVTTDTIIGTRNENSDPAQLLSVSEDEDFKLLADYTIRDKAEYRFISFPLIAGVTFDKSKFSFYASAGLALNFSSSYYGKILAPDSAYLFSIRDVSTSPFNNLTGFTLVGSAGFGYRVTDKVKLMVEPSFFRQLPDITKTEYRLSQRFSGYGVQAGIIYKL